MIFLSAKNPIPSATWEDQSIRSLMLVWLFNVECCFLRKSSIGPKEQNSRSRYTESLCSQTPWMFTMWSCLDTLIIALASSSISILAFSDRASLIATSNLKKNIWVKTLDTLKLVARGVTFELHLGEYLLDKFFQSFLHQ